MRSIARVVESQSRSAEAMRALLVTGWLCAASVSSSQTIRVVDFVQDGLYDYGIQFLTADANEIRAVDDLRTAGWRRSGFEFKAYDTPGADRVPVCRFYSARFGVAVRHFYTAFPEECEELKSSGDWTYEGRVFYVPMPDASGACAAGTVPMFRGYRVRHHYVPGEPGGAYVPVPEGPQHRLAPVRPPEGNYDGRGAWSTEGPGGIAFCVPASYDLAQARLTSLATGTWELRIDGALRSGWPLTSPLRLTFGTVTGSVRSDNWYLPEALAEYQANVTGQWGAQTVRGRALWRPLEDRIVVEVAKAVSPTLSEPYFVLSLEYDGGNALWGSAFDYQVCGPDLCPYRSIPYTVTGERR